MTSYKIIKETSLPASQIELEIEIQTEEILKHRPSVIKGFQENLVLDGFRKGHVPEKIILERVGDLSIWEDASKEAIKDLVPEALIEKKIQAIGHPDIMITKMAINSPVEIKVTVSIVPKFDLPDYKGIAKKINSEKEETVEVTDKEVDETIEGIRKNFSTKEGEKEVLPELDLDFVKKLGNFASIEEFKSKIKENLGKEKEHRNKEKKRLSIVEKIIDKSKIDLPKILIESELSRIEAQFRGDIERMGVKFEDYLKHLKKEIEEVRKDWEPDAEKRAKLQVIINKIAEKEKIEPEKDKIEEELKHLLEHHKDADPARARIYLESVITNEKVFEFLENQK